MKHILGTDSFEMMYLGQLTTERLEATIPEGLIVLDKSSYFTVEDFELEFECSSRKTGEEYFHQFLEKHEIPLRKTENKILRFYNEKINRSDT
ncbi:MAG: CYTH domain-containing protein [Bacillus sp. (in: Bacteria)]|nr:CYTH domain-containing protein [Bacillus sp. (in: firmicutes)]